MIPKVEYFLNVSIRTFLGRDRRGGSFDGYVGANIDCERIAKV